MGTDIRLELAEPGSDPATLAELVHHLRLELLDLDVDSVSQVRDDGAPSGSKGLEMASAAALLVQVNASAAALRGVISAVRAWLARSRDARLSVMVTIGERTLELSRATVEQQDQLVQEFLRSQRTEDA